MSTLAHYSTLLINEQNIGNKDVYFLYKIVNTLNSKIYVGATVNPYKRWYGHTTKNSACLKLRHAMNKHGRENFKLEILCVGDKEYILELEKKLIESFDTIKSGYNIDQGGRGVNKITTPARPIWDSPMYVSGWWFPSGEQALNSLNWTRSRFDTRKYSGSLAETCHKKPERLKNVYYKGFWFPSVDLAISLSNQSRKIILSYHHRILRREHGLIGSL